MAKIREIYDNTIKDNGNKQVIYPITRAQAVYTDTNQKIQDLLNEGYRFGGLATPDGVPSVKQRTFYIAVTSGQYTNYGNLTVEDREIAFLLYDGVSWQEISFGDGIVGKSAYESAVDNGFIGTEEEWLESLKATVTLYDETGSSTEGGMTQRAITERFDMLELAGSTITFTANPSVISQGTTTSVVLSVLVSGLSSGSTNLIEILDSNNTVIESGTGLSLSTTVQLSAAASYTARVTHGAATRSISRTIPVVGLIYYGSGSNASDFQNNRVEYPSPTASVARTYDVIVRNDGDYVFFQIPSSMTINNITLGGFGFPITLMETSGGYKLYQSDNTYRAGTLTLIVS